MSKKGITPVMVTLLLILLTVLIAWAMWAFWLYPTFYNSGMDTVGKEVVCRFHLIDSDTIEICDYWRQDFCGVTLFNCDYFGNKTSFYCVKNVQVLGCFERVVQK